MPQKEGFIKFKPSTVEKNRIAKRQIWYNEFTKLANNIKTENEIIVAAKRACTNTYIEIDEIFNNSEEMRAYMRDMYTKTQHNNPLKAIFKSIATKAKQIRESNIERKLQVYRVQDAMERKELEEEAQPLVSELGVSMDDAIAYIQAQKKKEKHKEMMSKVHEVASKIGDNYREQEIHEETIKDMPETKKKRKVAKDDKVSEIIKGSFGM